MKTEFTQKKRFNKRKFKLTHSSIQIESTSQNANNRYEVALENIGTKLHYHAESKRQYFIAAIVMGSLYLSIVALHLAGRVEQNVVMGLSAPTGIVLSVLLLRSYKDDIFLVGGQTNIVFYRTKPSEKEVLEFINLIIEQRKNYLKSKYTDFDATTSDGEFFARLNWLRSQDIITTEEYQDYENSFNLLKLL